jgi:3-oxoacyl-[acyl-carrier protein] reductase
MILNVASTAAFFPSAGLTPYNVSKAGLVMLTKVCALEWAKYGIRVLGVAPGKVDTEMVAPILEWTANNNAEINPLRRLGTPHEIAELIAYLVTDDAKYMTGVIVPIDGGELLTYGR